MQEPSNSSLFSPKQLLWPIISIIIYGLVFLALYNTAGGTLSALAVLPAVVGGWFLGIRGGLIFSVISIIITAMIFLIFDALDVFLTRGTTGFILVFLLGIGAGWLSNLLKTVREQAATLQREIEERQRAEQARQESENRLLTVVNNAPILLWSINKNQEITLLKGHALDSLNLKTDSLVGQPISALYSKLPDMQKDVEIALQGKATSATFTLGEFTFDARYIPLYDDEKQMTGIVGVATDISEQQKTKAALGDAQSNLAEKNQQLERAQEFFRSTLDQLIESTNRSSDINELRPYLKQVQTEFSRFT